MSDIHALSGAYAVDALDDIERERFERHLAECGDCRAEVDSLREAGATLTETSAVTPPAELRESVLSMISTVRPLPPETPAVPEPRHTRRLPGLLAAAAAVAALVGGGVLVAQPWEDSSQTELTAAERVVQADDVRAITTYIEPPHPSGFVRDQEATLYLSDSLGQAALVTSETADELLIAEQVYELWLQKDGEMVPAGLMTDAGEPFLLDGRTDDATAAAITIEPAGGSPQPTMAPLALFPFSQAR